MPWRREKTPRGLAQAFKSLLEDSHYASQLRSASAQSSPTHSGGPSPLAGQQQPPPSSSASVTLSVVTAQQLCLTPSLGPSSSFNAHLLESSDESPSGGCVNPDSDCASAQTQMHDLPAPTPSPQAAMKGQALPSSW